MRYGEDIMGKHIVFLSWRDTSNPEGGGAERYLEQVASGLRDRGCHVTVFSAAHPGAVPDEVVDGIRYVRRGSKTSVYVHGMRALRRGDLGDADVVVDVQNGLPFFSRLVTRAPVVVLVHHVHREQWPVVYPGLSGRVGWWIERRLAPWIYRHCQYVAVSRATRNELRGLGVQGPRVAVVHNGTDPAVGVATGPDEMPTVAVVGRLVPHKRVEIAIDAVRDLQHELPDLRLLVVGDGWWADELQAYAAAHDAGPAVEFLGHVSEETKHAVYERAWVLALPSLKEGWGLVVSEAGMHRTPTVAFSAAGGTRESVEQDRSGLLVDTREEFTEALRQVLVDEDLRIKLSSGALEVSHQYTWAQTQESFAEVLRATLSGRLIDCQDPEEVTVPRRRLRGSRRYTGVVPTPRSGEQPAATTATRH